MANHKSNRKCLVEGCGRKMRARDLCQMHYMRMKRHGEPGPGSVTRFLTADIGSWAEVLEARTDRSAGLDACWEWVGPRDPDGYGWASFHGLRVKAHRVAWEASHGIPIPEGLLVRHTCDNPPCVNPAHLLTGTVLENNRDKVARKRMADRRGPNSLTRKLDTETILEIRRMRDQGALQREIAEHFGIAHQHVSKIVRRETWVNV